MEFRTVTKPHKHFLHYNMYVNLVYAPPICIFPMVQTREEIDNTAVLFKPRYSKVDFISPPVWEVPFPRSGSVGPLSGLWRPGLSFVFNIVYYQKKIIMFCMHILFFIVYHFNALFIFFYFIMFIFFLKYCDLILLFIIPVSQFWIFSRDERPRRERAPAARSSPSTPSQANTPRTPLPDSDVFWSPFFSIDPYRFSKGREDSPFPGSIDRRSVIFHLIAAKCGWKSRFIFKVKNYTPIWPPPPVLPKFFKRRCHIVGRGCIVVVTFSAELKGLDSQGRFKDFLNPRNNLFQLRRSAEEKLSLFCHKKIPICIGPSPPDPWAQIECSSCGRGTVYICIEN